MGMSATQARYLSLVAQQSNLEYQGQQINQERSILSQQVSDLYNSLLAMEVPTPPSTQDYTKVVYSGSIGATNYTFDATNVKPGENGNYSVTLGTAEYGQSLQKNKGYAITKGGTETVKGTKYDNSYVNSYEKPRDNGLDLGTETPQAGDAYVTPITLELVPKDYTGLYIKQEKNSGASDGSSDSGESPASDGASTPDGSPAPEYEYVPATAENASGQPLFKKDGDNYTAFSGEVPYDFTGIYMQLDEDSDGDLDLVQVTMDNYNSADNALYFQYHAAGSLLPEDPTTATKVIEDTTHVVEQAADYKVTTEQLPNLYYINNDGTLTKATVNDLNEVKDGSGNITHYTFNLNKHPNGFFIKGQGEDTAELPSESKDGQSYTIAGKNAMTLEYARDKGYINETQYNGYINAITNANLKASNGTPYAPDDFYLYIDDDDKVHFALKTDVQDGNGAATTYDYIPDGKFTKDVKYDDCKLTFDPSSGRITQIEVPSTYNADGTVASYTTMDLKASQETDELAYQDAMAKYEYEQYLYDKEQAEINAKTEKIQAMDRNLELKLQRLDTQRTQITTEIEALDKVLNDNIEASYKTFSG